VTTVDDLFVQLQSGCNNCFY